MLGVAVVPRHERDAAGKVSSRMVSAVRPEPMQGKEPGEYGEQERREMRRAPKNGASVFPSHVMGPYRPKVANLNL